MIFRAILIQAGYATIKAIDHSDASATRGASAAHDAAPSAADEAGAAEEVKYLCGFPNRDVSKQFRNVVKSFLNDNASNNPVIFNPLHQALGKALARNDFAAACDHINELICGIKFDAFAGAHEAFYRTVIALWLHNVFNDVREETPNYRGRSDIEFTTSANKVTVIELKLLHDRDEAPINYDSDEGFQRVKERVTEFAEEQIFDRGYGVNPHNVGKPVTGLILVISERERRVVAWRGFEPEMPVKEGRVPLMHMHCKLVVKN